MTDSTSALSTDQVQSISKPEIFYPEVKPPFGPAERKPGGDRFPPGLVTIFIEESIACPIFTGRSPKRFTEPRPTRKQVEKVLKETFRRYVVNQWQAIAIGVSLGLLVMMIFHLLTNEAGATY
jgi:hypothetical protein